MSIQTVSGLTVTSGDALILQVGKDPVSGSYFKDADGNVSVQFNSTPAGLLVLVLRDGHDSRYPGQFEGGTFVGQPDLLPADLPLPAPDFFVAAKKSAADKIAADKAASDKVAADKKAASDKKAAADKAAADKAAADKAADKAAADKAAADKAAADKPQAGAAEVIKP